MIGVSLAQEVNPSSPTDFTWNQTTGLINIPVARTLPAGTFFSAFDFKSKAVKNLFGSEFLAGDGDQGNGSFHFMFVPHRRIEIATMGLHDVNRGGNVNSLDRLLKIPPASSFSTAIKVLVADETDDFPAIAVGVENLTYPKGPADPEPNQRFREPGYYAVASKAIPVGNQLLNVHAGFGTGRFQNRPFGGLEYAFHNGLGLITEYDGYHLSGGLRYTGIKNLRVTLGVQGGDPTFQIGYHFNPFDLFSGKGQRDYNPYKFPERLNKRDVLDSPTLPSPETSTDVVGEPEMNQESVEINEGDRMPSETVQENASEWKLQNPYLRGDSPAEIVRSSDRSDSRQNWKLSNPYLGKNLTSEQPGFVPRSGNSDDWKAKNPYLK